jgi:hypothetical protein
MTPSEYNHWLAFILLGLPLAAVAGPFAWRAALILAGLAVLTLHLASFAVTAGNLPIVIRLARPAWR